MKICYIAPTNSIHTKRFISFFKNRGHNIYLISFEKVINSNDFKDIIIYYIPIKFKKLGVLYFRILFKIKKILKEINPDILHSHYLIPYGWLGAFSGFKPFVISIWGSDFLSKKAKFFIYKILNKFTLKKADLIVTDSNYVISICNKITNFKVKTFLFFFSPDFDKFDSKGNLNLLMKNLNISKGTKVILCPRGFSPVYNNETILKSIPEIVKKFDNIVFLFIIKSFEKNKKFSKKLVKLINKLKIENYVRIIDEVEYGKMPLYYKLSDIVISIPKTDTLAATIFEAMTMGKPLILSNLIYYSGIIENEKNALTVDCKNSDEVARAVISLLENKTLYKKIKYNGIITVKKYGDLKNNIFKLEEIYKSLYNKKEHKNEV